MISTDAITVVRASDMVIWSPPRDPGGELLRYEIRIRQNGTDVTTIEVLANSTAYDLLSLVYSLEFMRYRYVSESAEVFCNPHLLQMQL